MRSTQMTATSTAPRVVRRPAERGRAALLALACGCSCCCCCCLHSVGGVLGAAIASRRDRNDGVAESVAAQAAARAYWVSFAAVSVLALVLGSLDDLAVGVILLLMGLPAIQLFASIPAALVLTRMTVERKDVAYRWLGRTTLLGFLWSLAGTAVMIGLAMAVAGLS